MTFCAVVRRLAGSLLALLPMAEFAWSQTPISADPQEAAFRQHCAMCHNNPATRAPGLASLRAMAPSFVVNALTSGIMQAQGAALSPAQRVAIAEYLPGRKVADEVPMAGRCEGTPPAFSLAGPSYNGWGANPENWRFQREPGIAVADLG